MVAWNEAAGEGSLVRDVHECLEADPDDEYDESSTGWQPSDWSGAET